MKKLLIVLFAVVGSFLVGYIAMPAEAIPPGGLWGRGAFRGFFLNQFDDHGPDVLPPRAGWGGNAFPQDMNDADGLVAWVRTFYNSANQQERTGARFIIKTMITPEASPNYAQPSPGDVDEWERRVRSSERRGLISWNYGYPHNYNSLYQGAWTGANPNDDAFFDDARTSVSIVFFDDTHTNIIYGIRRQCGNPVATPITGPIEDDVNWAITGRTTATNETSAARGSNPLPGDSIRWRHYMRNIGIHQSEDVWFAVRDWPSNAVLQAGQNGGTFGPGVERLVDGDEVTNIPIGTASGTQYCRYIYFEWQNGYTGGSGTSPPVCVTVAAAYDLQPYANVDRTSAQEGDTVTFTFSIDNTGTGDSVSVNCSVTGTQPAGVPAPPATSCPRTFPYVGGAVNVATQAITIGNQAPGARICRTLTVNPASSSVASRSSSEACVVIAKTPYVHFMGGDVWAGGGFVQPDGSCPTNSGADISTRSRTLSSGGGTAGSTVEYGAFALGQMTLFGSASKALLGSDGIGATSRSLSFANNTSGAAGNFAAPTHCIEDYVARYDSLPAAPAVGGFIDLNTASTVRHVSGNLRTTGILPGGSQQVYLVDGDVTIISNIHYKGFDPTYNGFNDIPSLLIIAKGNIYVEPDVSYMDGMFISRGTFFTCSPKPNPLLTTGDCSSRLTVNGTVKARSIDLYRSAGATGATPGERKQPAELFNWTPEMFLRNVLNNSAAPTLQTNDSRELPPRF